MTGTVDVEVGAEVGVGLRLQLTVWVDRSPKGRVQETQGTLDAGVEEEELDLKSKGSRLELEGHEGGGLRGNEG